MPRNGNGTYTLPAGNPVVTGTTISSTVQNNTTSDIATALTNSIAKDGQTTPTANLPMGTYRHTGVGNGVAATDYAALGQVQNTAYTLIGTIAGVDTITGVLTPTLTAYSAGQKFSFVSAGANTGAVTINIDSLGAKSITKLGTTALVANDIPAAGVLVEIEYDGTRFQLCNLAASNATSATSATSATTATNLAGGGAGQLPYQSAAGTTAMLAAGTAGQILTSAGAAPPTWAALTAGEILIQTQTASGATVLDFTTGISSTYDQYVLRVTDLSVATDNCNVLMRFSTDGGSSFISAASYVWNQILTTDGVNGATSGIGDTALRLITGQANTASIYCGGEIRFSGLSGSRYKGFNSDFTYARSGSNIATSIVGGWIANTTAVNAIRILLGGGTTFSGKFSLYGLTK